MVPRNPYKFGDTSAQILPLTMGQRLILELSNHFDRKLDSEYKYMCVWLERTLLSSIL